MRPRWFTVPAMLVAAACSAPAPGPPAATTPSAGQVTPSNIRRLQGAFPPGYEVSDITGTASPAMYWGLKPGWASEPPQCGRLADPPGTHSPEGLSGSGSGGVIYAVVSATPGGARPDPVVVSACEHWSMHSGRTTATVDRFDGPAIDDVPTVGMDATIRTVVEGGTETDLRATTTVGYLGSYVAFVTVVTDPGSSHEPLSGDLASRLLTQAVATVRG